jgi:hypothetical protein
VLDTGRAVADDEVELLLQLLEDALDAFPLQRVFVARLRGRKDVEIVVALILDQRLIEVGVAVDNIDEIEDTTRRSQPITRSRLRKPTSKSMTTVLWPRNASPAAKAAAVVVLPTPPLPDVIATTFATKSSLPLAAPGLVISRSPDACLYPPRQ